MTKTTAFDQMTAALAAEFAVIDTAFVADSQAWAKARVAAVAAYDKKGAKS